MDSFDAFYITLAPLLLPITLAIHVALMVNGHRAAYAQSGNDGEAPIAVGLAVLVMAVIAMIVFFSYGNPKALLFGLGVLIAHATLHLTIFNGLGPKTK